MLLQGKKASIKNTLQAKVAERKWEVMNGSVDYGPDFGLLLFFRRLLVMPKSQHDLHLSMATDGTVDLTQI